MRNQMLMDRRVENLKPITFSIKPPFFRKDFSGNKRQEIFNVVFNSIDNIVMSNGAEKHIWPKKRYDNRSIIQSMIFDHKYVEGSILYLSLGYAGDATGPFLKAKVDVYINVKNQPFIEKVYDELLNLERTVRKQL